MKKQMYTCIVCPNGCNMEVTVEEGNIISVEGNLCKKGIEYVKEEITSPKRTIATTVLVEDGESPLVSVRLTQAIPKNMIFEAMNEIKKMKIQAPVKTGDIVMKNLLGLDCNVMATMDCKKIVRSK